MNYILKQLIKNRLISANQYEEYKYALKVMFLKILHYFIILISGYLFNILTETVVFLFSYNYIRKYLGGFHSKNKYICLFLSGLFIVNLNIIINYMKKINMICMLIFIYISLFYDYYYCCCKYFLPNFRKLIIVIILFSNVFYLINQYDLLISIVYAILLNYILFKLEIYLNKK